MRIGITDYAQDALGDVVFVEVPELGATVEAGDTIERGRVHQVGVGHLRPVSGTIVEVNGDLADAPQRLNEDPYGEGWICVIELADPGQVDGLLDAAAYRALVEG